MNISFATVYPLPEAVLPECVISESGENYRGSQWITGDGDPCVPWNVSSVRTVSLKFGTYKTAGQFKIHNISNILTYSTNYY